VHRAGIDEKRLVRFARTIAATGVVVMTPELAELLFRKIEPGGELFFQSDIWDLALDAMTVLEASRFRNHLEPWSFERDNPYAAKSLREVRCEERGLRIWRMRYDRPA